MATQQQIDDALAALQSARANLYRASQQRMAAMASRVRINTSIEQLMLDVEAAREQVESAAALVQSLLSEPADTEDPPGDPAPFALPVAPQAR